MSGLSKESEMALGRGRGDTYLQPTLSEESKRFTWKAVVYVHMGRVVGLGAFLLSSLAYRSQNRDVLGLWSWPHLAIIVVVCTMFSMAVAHSWTRSRQMDIARYHPSLWTICSELAFLMWGTGFFLNGLDTSRNWGQVADLNLFGSSYPLAALLLWGALLVVTVGLAETIIPRGRTSRAGAIVLAVWVTVMFLLLIEGSIRVFAIVAPESQGYPTYTTALWSRKFVSLSTAGFRDAEHSRKRPDKNPKLLVVGDSLAFGWGLNRLEDRFGEQLAQQLTHRTGATWTALNASRGDTHTLTHIEFLKAMQAHQPEVTLLLYAFNDIDYLAQVTPREGQSEPASSLFARINPIRILFQNSFLFQEVYVRLRLITYRHSSEDNDPYENAMLLNEHFHDLARFVSIASISSRVVAIVPFNIGVAGSTSVHSNYNRFVMAAIAHGLPIWPAGQEVFGGHAYEDLVVNGLDSHPNELAHRLLADNIADRMQIVWRVQRASSEHVPCENTISSRSRKTMVRSFRIVRCPCSMRTVWKSYPLRRDLIRSSEDQHVPSNGADGLCIGSAWRWHRAIQEL